MNTFGYKNLRSKNYFEGWYFRFSTEKKNYAVIFAITKNSKDPHAFIQLFDDTSKSCRYLRFPTKDFKYTVGQNRISIGKNYLSENNVFIDVDNFYLHLNFSSKTTLSNIGNKESAMGYLSKVPLECFQEVIYLDGTASGTINGDTYNGKIYIEKTYGTKFPVQWIWLQSNHSLHHSSISFSVGKIPFVGIKIKGFLCVLHANKRLYHFYTGNFSKLRIKEDTILIKRGQYELHIIPISSSTIKLVGPKKKAEMSLDVFESLTAGASIKLFKKKALIFEDIYTKVGYENMW